MNERRVNTIVLRVGFVMMVLAAIIVCGVFLAGRTRVVSAEQGGSSLQVIASETGLIYLSADGTGSLSPTMMIDVNKPSAVATVRSAHFMCSNHNQFPLDNGAVSLAGTPVNWDQTFSSPTSDYVNTLANVTAVIAPILDAAPVGITSLQQDEAVTDLTDGCALYVIFDDPAQTETHTAFVFFGAQSSTGDTFALGLPEPLGASDSAEMGLAISFSFQGDLPPGSHECGDGPFAAQFSTIDVNGQRITSCAGGTDDATQLPENGNLITVGGLGDVVDNPSDPFQQAGDGQTPRVEDDELYDLTALLGTTEQNIVVTTLNPSNDDNIFGGHIYLSSPAIVGEGIVLSPLTATLNLDMSTMHTVTARVQDAQGNPVVGEGVGFAVTSGPHQGTNWSEPTDSNGEATFSYMGMSEGTDVIVAETFNGRDVDVDSNEVTVTWNAATAVSLQQNSATPADNSMIVWIALAVVIALSQVVVYRKRSL